MYELITKNNQFLNLDVLDEENEILKQTGFSGSNAKLLKGNETSYLFTDNRYELQAKKEVKDKSIKVVLDSFERWYKTSDFNDKVAYNSWCHSIEEVKNFGSSFVAKDKEPDYVIDRQPFEYCVEYAGDVAVKKVLEIRDFLEKKGLDAYIITNPTDLSWLLNIRSDVLPHSPVYRAFGLINKDGVMQLFNHPKQMKKYKRIGLWERETPAIFARYVKKYTNLLLPIWSNRAKKTKTEIVGSKNAHLKDGVAITKLIYWLYKNKAAKTEYDVAIKLQKLRQAQNGFYSESFGSIVAFEENAALPHYQPQEKKSKKIGKGLLLIDVGAHYFGGTTDMTRTISLGKPTLEQIKHNTLVLKAHINLATQVFYNGIMGNQLDILARGILLNEGLDYNHGTGHGVGNFLTVHERPSISKSSATGMMRPDIITSIEPAVYFEGQYGIRIENLYYVKELKNGNLCFNNLTLVPLDKSLIDFEYLSDKEKQFVFDYQKEVYSAIAPHLTDNENKWLKDYISTELC